LIKGNKTRGCISPIRHSRTGQASPVSGGLGNRGAGAALNDRGTAGLKITNDVNERAVIRKIRTVFSLTPSVVVA